MANYLCHVKIAVQYCFPCLLFGGDTTVGFKDLNNSKVLFIALIWLWIKWIRVLISTLLFRLYCLWMSSTHCGTPLNFSCQSLTDYHSCAYPQRFTSGVTPKESTLVQVVDSFSPTCPVFIPGVARKWLQTKTVAWHVWTKMGEAVGMWLPAQMVSWDCDQGGAQGDTLSWKRQKSNNIH